MKITFKSTIQQNGEQQVIEFSSPVTITKENNFTSFSFTEPESDVHNLIEISDKEINIFAGATTVILKKDEKFEFPLIIPMEDGSEHTFELVSHWTKTDFNEPNYYMFEYTLSRVQGNESVLIGTYAIELSISE